MKTKHTPGPWQISGVRGRPSTLSDNAAFHSVGPDGDAVAAVWYDPKTHVGWHDARLIAAAPDLLEALQEVVPMLEAALMFHGEPEQGSVGYKARAAIAKATRADHA